MSRILLKAVTRLGRDTRGVTLVEYGIAIGLAVFVGTTFLLNVLGVDIGGAMGNAGALMP